jgi:hypothetical protein
MVSEEGEGAELRQLRRSVSNQPMERKGLLGRRRINPRAKLNGLPPPDRPHRRA